MEDRYCKSCGINLLKPTKKQETCSRQCAQDWRSLNAGINKGMKDFERGDFGTIKTEKDIDLLF
jgi:hypothetical protein